jgi:hypothetical protein
MQIERDSRFEIAPPTGLPSKAVHLTTEIQLSEELDVFKLLEDRCRKTVEVQSRHREDLRAVLGAQKYERLISFTRDGRRKQAEGATGPSRDIDAAARVRAERREASRALLTEMRINVAELKKVSEASRRRLIELVPPFPEREGRPVELVRPNDVPRAIRERKTNPWTIVTPPYAGWAWSYAGYLGGFSSSKARFLSASSGQVGSSNGLSDGSAGDFDIGEMEYNTSIGFWYRMPSAGLIEVWVEAQCSAAHHHVTLYDEVGWSDSFCLQRDYLTLKTSGSVPDQQKESRMSWFDVDGYTSGNWDQHYLTDGNTYWAHLFSAAAYPANENVYVRVGTRTYNKCFANDVSTYSTADFRWFIKSVSVESTGS